MRGRSLLVLFAILSPSVASAAFLPGQTLNPPCGPTDPSCVVATTTVVSQYEVGTLTATSSATSSLAGSLTVAGTASTGALVVSGQVTIGTLSGILKAVAGVVTATLVNLASDVTGILGISNGGTGASTASGARANLGAAASGANTDITALSGLTTALSTSQGGTGRTNYTHNQILVGGVGNSITQVATSALGLSSNDIVEGSNQYFTNERTDDRVSTLLQAGSGISMTYNDAGDSLTISSTAGGGGGNDVNWSYYNASGIRPATTTNQVLIGGIATTSSAKLQVIGGATLDAATSTSLYSTVVSALSSIFDALTVRVATLYTATVGTLTATSTANLYGGVNTRDITATGTAHFSVSYATSVYASTTYATTSNIQNLNIGSLTGPLQSVNGLVSATGTISASYGGTGTTTFNSGGLVFSDGTKLTQPSTLAALFWDNANSRLGIGTSTPNFKLDVNNGSIAGNIIDRGGRVFDVRAYGAKCDTATDDTAAIQAAENARVAAGGGTLFIPPGICYISGTINITMGGAIEGVGKGAQGSQRPHSIIRTTSGTATIFNIVTDDAIQIRDLQIDATSYMTSGAAITIQPTNAATNALQNRGSIIENVRIRATWDGINLYNTSHFVFRDSEIHDFGNTAMYATITGVNPEHGEFVIEGNEFWDLNRTGQAALYFAPVSNTMISGNQFLGAQRGIYLSAAHSTTGTLIIDGNSFEQQTIKHIEVNQGQASIGHGNLIISDNEFSILGGGADGLDTSIFQSGISVNAGTGIPGSAQYIRFMTITGNVFSGGSTGPGTAFISLQDGRGVTIANNVMNQFGNTGAVGVTTGGNATNVTLTGNRYEGFASGIYGSLNGTTLVHDADVSNKHYIRGNLLLASYGAGTLTTDGSGNVTAASDERLKDIAGSFTRSIDDILKINSIYFHWNATSGLDTINQYAGFSAQNILSAIPEAVGSSTSGLLSLQDRPIIAAVVNAIKEIATIAGTFKNALIAWLGLSGNGLTQLCLDDVCMTKSQLAAMLATQGEAPSGALVSDSPQLILNGANPVVWPLNTPWNDGNGALFTSTGGSETIYSTTTVDVSTSSQTIIEYWAQLPGTEEWLHTSRTVLVE